MKYIKYKDLFKRKKTIKKKLFFYSSLYSNRKTNSKLKFKIMLKMQELKNKENRFKSLNRCILTNKSRSIMRLTNLSKTSFKEEYVNKNITGFTKSSW